jgi:hypothetical protein
MATKSNMTSSVPKPAMQGGHGVAPVQGADMQKKASAANPGASEIKYSVQPSGIGGTNPGAK